MMFQIHNLSATRKECTIDYSKLDLQNQFHVKLNALKGRVQLPGFRKGKAPLHQIEANYRESIVQDLLDEKIQSVWADVCKEQKVLEKPKVTILPDIKQGCDLKNDIHVTLQFDVYPQFDLIEAPQLLKTLKIELSPVLEVTEESKNSYRKVLELECSQDELVERSAALGDKVIIQVLYAETGKIEDKLELVLDETQTQKEFMDAVLGMNAGESRSFDYIPQSYDPAAEPASLEGAAQPMAVTVTVHSVHALIPPTLEKLCAFVRDLNGTTDENGEVKLNAWIESTIIDLNCQQAFRKNEKILKNALAQHYTFEVPSLHLRDLTFETEEKREETCRSIRMNYVIGAYAELFSIQPSEKDFDLFAKIFAQDRGLPLQYLSQILQMNKEIQKTFQDTMVEQSVLKYLLEAENNTALTQPVLSMTADHDHTHCGHDHSHDATPCLHDR